MAQTNFNVGAIANDGTGEPLRQAFQEQQAMNTELYTTKVDKVVGKKLSDNNYTDAEVVKLDGIEEGAEVNVQANLLEDDNTNDSYIIGKEILLKTFIKSNENLAKAQRKDDTLYGILDQYTGEEITLTKTTDINDSDGVIYFDLGAEKFKRNFTFLRPEWFGLDGVNDQVAINKCFDYFTKDTSNIFDALTGGSVVLDGSKVYNTSAPITMSRYQKLIGNGAKILTTTTTCGIKCRRDLISTVFSNTDMSICDLNIEGDGGIKAIDMTGFVHSKVKNVQILVRNSTDDTIGIALIHGEGGQDYCYFNEVDNFKINLNNSEVNTQRGTGILISGFDGNSGANVNKINQGVISGLELNGIIIDNNSFGNLILNTDFEAFGIDDRLNTAIRLKTANSNTIISPHVENYQRSIIIEETSNGNYIQGLSDDVIQELNVDLGGGNVWVGYKNISVGGSPLQTERSSFQVTDNIFPSFIINSSNADLASRNYGIMAGFTGDNLLFRKSNVKGGNPINDGFDFLELTSDNVLLSKVNNKIQAFAGTSLEVVGEGGAQEVTQTKSLSGSFGVNAFYGDFGVKGAMWFGQYKDGKGIIWNNGAFPIGFFVNGVENFTMNVGGTTTFNFNVIVPDGTANTHAINLGQLNKRTGWASYKDTVYTSASPFTIADGVTSAIPNNAGTVINNQLPLGVTSFYNSGTSKITPELNGDYYVITIRLKATTTATNGGHADFGIDIGGALGIIFKETVVFSKGAGIEHNFAFVCTGYTATTFVANGGIPKLTALGGGDVKIYDIEFQIDRTHRAI